MKTIAITSGKGGVGKTTIAANLAIALADLKESVIVFDADFGLANLDIILGQKASKNLLHVVTQQLSIAEILQKGPNNIRFVAGGSGVQELMNLSEERLDHFFDEFSKLEGMTDFLIIDTAAGLTESVIRFAEAADEVLLICTPDPTSMMDAYATCKTIFSRNPNALIQLSVNMVENDKIGQSIYEKLNRIIQEFLGKKVSYIGCLHKDPAVIFSTRQRKPFVLSAPNAMISKDIQRLAKILVGKQTASSGVQKKPSGLFSRLRRSFGNKQKVHSIEGIA